MLCRALATALALSCTFPRHVTGQATTPNVHRKDLICVLWLSGIQKEDLDVSMLRKLQRHNVNIDDMNQENLRDDCLKLTKEIDLANAASTTIVPVMNKPMATFTRTHSKKDVTQFDKELMTMMADMLYKKGKIEDNKTYAVSGTGTLTVKDKTESQNSPTEDENTRPFAMFSDLTGSDGEIRQHNNIDPKLEKVMQFWQMFKSTPVPGKIIEVTTMSSTFRIIDNVDKYKEKYSSEKPTNTPPVDLQKLSQQIDKLMRLLPQNEKYINKYDEINGENKLSQRIITAPKELRDVPPKSLMGAKKIKQYEYPVSRNIGHSIDPKIFLGGQGVNSYTDIPVEDNNIAVKILNSNISLKNINHTLANQSANNITKKDDEITKNVIKEIAENIKALVLKDLRKEIASNTNARIAKSNTTLNASKTVTSTPGIVNQNEKSNKTHDATQVIEKFIKLLEQFQADKKGPVATAKLRIKISEAAPMTPVYTNPLGVDMNTPILLVAPKLENNLNNRLMFYSPFGVQTIPIKNTNKPTIANVKKIERPPITLQTNSGEIPPLGIPISKPLNMIHQNIVVTTKHPFGKKRDTSSDPYKQENAFKDNTRISDGKKYTYNTNPIPLDQQKSASPKPVEPYKNARIKIQSNFNPSPRFDNEKVKTSEQRSYNHYYQHPAQNNYNTVLNNDHRLENHARFDENLKLSEQSHYQNIRLDQEEAKRTPNFDTEKPKLLDLQSYDNSRYRNHINEFHSSQFEDLKNKHLGQNSYTSHMHNLDNHYSNFQGNLNKPLEHTMGESLTRNQGEHHLSRYEDGYQKPLGVDLYNINPPRSTGGQHPWQYEERSKNRENDLQSPHYEDEKFRKPFEQNPYNNEPPRNNEVNQRLPEKFSYPESRPRFPTYENEKLKSMQDNVYKYDRPRNREDDQRNLPLQDDRMNAAYLNSNRYRSPETGRDLPRFETDKPKLLKQSSYKTEISGHRPRTYDEEKPYSGLYNNKRFRHERNEYRLPRVDNEKQKDHDDFGYSIGIIKSKKEKELPRFFNDKIKPLEQRNHRPQNNRDKNDNHQLSFEDIMNNKLNHSQLYEIDTKYPEDKISFGSFKSQERERFHEILERDWSEERDNTKIEKDLSLASRQQQPLNDVKKASRYDDTHFNNFLKSQQKVNDMLERILATKTSHIGPRSVETP